MNIPGTPIGKFLTPFKDVGQIPTQVGRSGIEVVIDVFPQRKEILNGLQKFHHVTVLYHLHQRAENSHIVVPLFGIKRHGINVTRSPERPENVGFSIMRLVGILGSLMVVEGILLPDQTPVLDIKPYISHSDMCDALRQGCFAECSANKSTRKVFWNGSCYDTESMPHCHARNFI